MHAPKIKALITVFIGALTPSLTLAQNLDLTQPPAAIDFAPLREVRKSEFFTESTVSFPSPATSEYPENDVVRLSVFLPTDSRGPVPVVVLLHFWGATDDRLERSVAKRLAEQGIGSVLMPLPYHLSRTPNGYESGELAVVPDIERLKQTTAQSVLDLRRTVDWIVSRSEFSHDQIGLGGTSLGAIVGALGFAVEPRFAASCYLLGGADIAHILWNSTRVVSQREALRKQGMTEASIRQQLSQVEPLNYLRRDDDRPSFVIAAKYDTVIPTIDSEKLINALGNPQTLWLDTGHYGGALVQAKLVNTVSSFFAATFKGSGFRAPSSLFAPTIRLGASLNDREGLQISAGFDIWRLQASRETFGSILFTPSGAQGFVGQTLSKNVALGIMVLPKRTTFGLLWSVVL